MINQNTYYNVNDFEKISMNLRHEKTITTNKKITYYNTVCAFDIETSSIYRDTETQNTYTYNQISLLNKKLREKLEKIAIMYIWQFGINGYCFVGRTWTEFLQLLSKIENFFKLDDKKRIIIYVHNLSYEFQFLRNWFIWNKVFAIDERKPIYAITGGVEFRCSYILSGYNLDTLAKNLINHKIDKLKSLDYTLTRHTQTPLSETEIQYCLNDIKIVMFYISEYIEKVGNITNIPLTKTAAVRIYTRKNCFFIENNKNWSYINHIKNLQINDLDELNTLQRAFCGGFTHANANYVNKIEKNVASYDFTSSYPAVMIAEKYPSTKGEKIQVKNNKEFLELIQRFCCVFDIEFNNIFASVTYENYISTSKCFVKENYSENNGRLICAKRICLTITEIDFKIIEKLYKYENYRIGTMYIYRRSYLPTEFVTSILKLYKDKTELKGIDGKENEYLNSKEMLNSCYGMCVTNPLHENYIYDNENWDKEILTDNEKQNNLDKYNKSKNRFLFYLWGVYVTAYARKNLFTAIFELKNDYIYSDTDSVKFVNLDNHSEYFAEYNKYIEYKLKTACNYHKIDFNLCAPKNKQGKVKMLGVWDFEGVYRRFKTLGAKRYMVECENALTVDGKSYDFSLTVSGVNKKNAIPYLLDTYKDKIFENFTNYLRIPPGHTGKNIHTYIDYETSGTVTDYNGNTAKFYEKSGVHLENTEYTLNLSAQFLKYLLTLND